MTEASGIQWLLRIILAALVVGSIGGFFFWFKTGKGGWRDPWKELSGSLKKQVVCLVLTASGSMLVTILLPLASMEPQSSMTSLAFLGSLWIVLAAWALSIGSAVVVNMVQWKYDINVVDNLLARRMQTRIHVLQRIVVVIIWIGATAAILMQFERFRTLGTTLLASAGVLSIILGISAQKTFGSMIAGIQIALSNPISLDDVVIVEGEWGRIEEITFTYVVVKIWDQRRLIVPVTYFLEKPFQNWTRKSAEITGSVFLHVDYETPLDSLRAEALRLCESAGPLWDGKTCVLQVTEAGSEDMTIRILASSPDASSAWDLRCLIREGLIAYMKANCPDCLPKRRLTIADNPDTGNA